MNELQNKIEKKLKEAKVDFVCEYMGIDFFKIFIEPYENLDKDPYEKHIWKITKSSKVGYTISAIPPSNMFNEIPWEEWFPENGKNNHFLLYTVKKENSTGQWKGELDDKDHPSEVLGYQWYFVPDDNLVPLLLRKK